MRAVLFALCLLIAGCEGGQVGQYPTLWHCELTNARFSGVDRDTMNRICRENGVDVQCAAVTITAENQVYVAEPPLSQDDMRYEVKNNLCHLGNDAKLKGR